MQIERLPTTFANYSSHTVLEDTLHFIPRGVTLIICDYDDEKWIAIERSKSERISKIFHTMITCFSLGCFKAKYDQELIKALFTGNVSKAIESIKAGAKPHITGQQFACLLTLNKTRSLRFILGQMKLHDVATEYFEDISRAICSLPNPLFSEGVRLYLEHQPILCVHRISKLRDEAKRKSDSDVISVLAQQKMQSSCLCETNFTAWSAPELMPTDIEYLSDSNKVWAHNHKRSVLKLTGSFSSYGQESDVTSAEYYQIP